MTIVRRVRDALALERNVSILCGVAPTVGGHLRDDFGAAVPFWIALLAGLVMVVFLQKVAISHRSSNASDIRCGL